MPTVSVILPTYNRAHTLGKAINSVLAQSYLDFELIIVDDGSTDGTDVFVKGYSDPRVCYLHLPDNRGAAAARNFGIQSSVGRLIAFQDSDDEWAPHKLEAQMREFDSSEKIPGAVYSRFCWKKGNLSGSIPSKYQLLLNRFLPAHFHLQGEIHNMLLNGNFITTQAVMLCRECLDREGLFDESLPRLQDWELWLRISKSYRFRYIDQPLVTTYASKDSISSDRDALIRALILIADKHGSESNELLAHCQFAIGDVLLQSGELHKGRNYLIQAIKNSPQKTTYMLALCISLIGAESYSRLFRKCGMSYM